MTSHPSALPSGTVGHRSQRVDIDDNPSSDATLWEGFASDLDGIVTPPIHSPPRILQDLRGPTRPASEQSTDVDPNADAVEAHLSSDKADSGGGADASTPPLNTDQHQQLLRELGWDSPPRATISIQQPALRSSGSLHGVQNVPKSSYSIDGVDVGAPWSQTGLYPTQYLRDQWLIDVGLNKQASGSSARGSCGKAVAAPASASSTPPDEHLEEIVRPSPRRLGLGQMRTRRQEPTTFVVPRSSHKQARVAAGPRLESTAAAQSSGNEASPTANTVTSRPVRTGGLLDQLDAQIAGFHRGAIKDNSAPQRQTVARFPPSVSNRSRPDVSPTCAAATDTETPPQLHSRAQYDAGRSSTTQAPSDSDKENRGQQRKRTAAGASGSSRGVPVLCIDSDDDNVNFDIDGHSDRLAGRVSRPSSRQNESDNAFEVLLKSSERATASPAKGKGRSSTSPTKATTSLGSPNKAIASSSSPTRLRFSSSNIATSSRQTAPGKAGANQSKLNLSIFRASGTASGSAPHQDRSTPIQPSASARNESDRSGSGSRRAVPSAAERSRPASHAPSSLEDSIGLRALEDQDWNFGCDEEDELQKIEAAIAAEPGPDSDPIFFDDDDDESVRTRTKDRGKNCASGPESAAATSVLRRRLTIPLRSSVAPPATTSMSAQPVDFSDEVEIVDDHLELPSYSPGDDESGRAGLGIKLIADLSQETQAMFLRQVTAKRKATDTGDTTGDSESTSTRRAKGKGKGKTWESTWTVDDDNDDDDDDDDSDDDDGAMRGTGRKAGSSSTGRGRGKSAGTTKAKATPSGRGTESAKAPRSRAKTSGGGKRPWFKKKGYQYQAKRANKRR